MDAIIELAKRIYAYNGYYDLPRIKDEETAKRVSTEMVNEYLRPLDVKLSSEDKARLIETVNKLYSGELRLCLI